MPFDKGFYADSTATWRKIKHCPSHSHLIPRFMRHDDRLHRPTSVRATYMTQHPSISLCSWRNDCWNVRLTPLYVVISITLPVVSQSVTYITSMHWAAYFASVMLSVSRNGICGTRGLKLEISPYITTTSDEPYVHVRGTVRRIIARLRAAYISHGWFACVMLLACHARSV